MNVKTGKGFVADAIQASDISNENHSPLYGFMPGYSLLLAAGFFTGLDGITLIYLYDALSIILLFIFSYLISQRLAIQSTNQQTLLLLGLLGFSLSPFHYLPATDVFALTVFVAGAYCLTRYVENPEEYCPLVVSILLLGVGVCLRYAYFPLLAIIPFVLLYHRYRTREVTFLKAFWLSSLALGIIAIALLGFQASITGKGNYLAQMDESFFPAHLLHIRPFGLHTLTFISPGHYSLLANVHIWLPALLNLIGFVITAGIFAGFCFLIHKRVGGYAENWALICLFVTCTTLAMLAYLSVRVPHEQWEGVSFWTYLMEPRYYAPIVYCWMLILPYLGALLLKTKFLRLINLSIGAFVVVNLLFWFLIHSPIKVSNEKLIPYSQQDLKSLSPHLLEAQNSSKVALISNPLTRRYEWQGIRHIPFDAIQDANVLKSSQSIHVFAYQSKQDEDMRLKLEDWEFQVVLDMQQGTLWEKKIQGQISKTEAQ